MRVLIDILHPAHVHVFKWFRREMIARGHEVLVVSRDKDVTLELLEREGIEHEVLSTQKKGMGLVSEMFVRTVQMFRHIRRTRPDVMTGVMGPVIALTGRLTGTPSVVFYDTEIARRTNWFTFHLASVVCTGTCFQDEVPGVHVSYRGYQELAYLHPERFEPDPERAGWFGVDPEQPFALVRFVGLDASHDQREPGLTDRDKIRLVQELESDIQVVVSSERPLPPAIARYAARGPVEEIHHLLAHARIFVGESATMASEAAVLGVPAVYVAELGRGYTDEQEHRYGLVRRVSSSRISKAITVAKEQLGPDAQARAQSARKELLHENVELTSWMVDFFERSYEVGGG